ncbi:ribonuclease H2 subunit A [Cladophialophora psammophila CBS 110553]|uniref:Ribonuclease n=1 Tax=Cladophialophora psammophila CBS 110553 TaxID=1182543 RepID=W9X5V0_9EURO|nr:ribonuclease H2 subunit A [Cladophialophora psammophila CBS 110553]EXJ65819.1 ribonuclease H2 subunit A [Cladophialophora psammophila CBS 110553]
MEDEDIAASTVFTPPSVQDNHESLLSGRSYAHYSDVPEAITIRTASSSASGTPCVLGVDEAGRGPVIGPMVYGVFYLPVEIQQSLLTESYHFDDSKVLTPAVRASLMKAVCTAGTDLFKLSGWAVKSLSARDIGAGMMKNGGSYNLNAQAMDATVELIRGVLQQGVNVTEIYVDTIGKPAVYQKKLELIFPTIKITVEKKADSLFPCVSAASVVAKVTRDVSCEALLEAYTQQQPISVEDALATWGSGYPSDARCVGWLKSAIDPVWGFGNECRFSWGTVKDILEQRGGPATKTEWPDQGEDENVKLSLYFSANGTSESKTETDELRTWFGTSVGQEAF